jgi:hypothetical protein
VGCDAVQLGECFLMFQTTVLPSWYSSPTLIALWKDLVYANTGTAKLRFTHLKKKLLDIKFEYVAILVY